MRFKCASASWVDGLWLTSDESRTECVETWTSDDNGRQLVPGSIKAQVTTTKLCAVK